MEHKILRSYIIKQYREQFNENIKLPSAVYKILSEYVIYILIIDTDKEYDDTDKMIYSLIVRNMMVIRKNSYNKLPAPAFITPMYPFLIHIEKTRII